LEEREVHPSFSEQVPIAPAEMITAIVIINLGGGNDGLEL